jgi:hypothetical protein
MSVVKSSMMRPKKYHPDQNTHKGKEGRLPHQPKHKTGYNFEEDNEPDDKNGMAASFFILQLKKKEEQEYMISITMHCQLEPM